MSQPKKYQFLPWHCISFLIHLKPTSAELNGYSVEVHFQWIAPAIKMSVSFLGFYWNWMLVLCMASHASCSSSSHAISKHFSFIRPLDKMKIETCCLLREAMKLTGNFYLRSTYTFPHTVGIANLLYCWNVLPFFIKVIFQSAALLCALADCFAVFYSIM